jgi:small-conductance mechanosensitive channel
MVRRMNLRLIWLLLMCSWVWTEEPIRIHHEAELVIHGAPITVLRATLFNYTPEERVALAYRRITELLNRAGPGVVSHRITPQGTLLTIDGADALMFTNDDANHLLGETLTDAVAHAQTALTEVILEDRGQSLSQRFFSSGLQALLGTAIFAAVISVLVVMRRLFLRGLSHIELRGQGLFGNREVESFLRNQLLRGLISIVHIGIWSLGILASYVWLTWTLGAFPMTRDIGNELGDHLLNFTLNLLRGIGAAVPGLAVVIAIIVLTGFLSHVLKLFFQRIENRRINLGWLNHNTAVPTRRISIVILWIFAVAMSYPYLPGSGSDAFKGLSVFVGVLVSLGGAGLVGQVASGYIVTYLGIVRVGDYVIVGNVEGVVKGIGIFNTQIETIFNESMSVPNILILTTTSTNLSRFPKHQGVVVQAVVTIGYDVPWRQVHALLLAAAARTPGLQAQPEAYVQQRALADFYAEYHLCAYLLQPIERIPVMSRLYAEIQDQFNQAGVQILSPHFMQEPKKPAVVPRERWLLTTTENSSS